MALLNRKSKKAVTKRLQLNHIVYQVPGKETFKLTQRGVTIMTQLFGPPTGDSGEYDIACINRLELALDEGENNSNLNAYGIIEWHDGERKNNAR